MRSGEVSDDVTWTTAELALLRHSIRESGVEDWRTLGDWAQVTSEAFKYQYNFYIFDPCPHTMGRSGLDVLRIRLPSCDLFLHTSSW